MEEKSEKWKDMINQLNAPLLEDREKITAMGDKSIKHLDENLALPNYKDEKISGNKDRKVYLCKLIVEEKEKKFVKKV
jgi:hypothetical protein